MAEKVLVANIKGPSGKQGPPGAKGDTGDLTSIGGIEEISAIVEERIYDIPDLTLIFENQLI